ncbi:MAG: response regulator [Chloroflexi bacterium]|nr:response regulator [Chloroflexota bacterium]
MDGPRRILLVEDNRMDAELLLEAFGETLPGGEIHLAPDGQVALDCLLGNDALDDRVEPGLPELVLLDLKLPGVSGFEVLNRIKTTPGVKRLPVVVLTSSRERSDRALAYDLGANSFLVKPLTYAGFLETARAVQHYWLTLNVAPPEN